MASVTATRFVAPVENVEFDFLSALDIEGTSVEHAMRELSRGANASATVDGGAVLWINSGLYSFLPSSLLSTAVHGVVLLASALWFLPPPVDNSPPPILVTEPEVIEEIEEVFSEELAVEEIPPDQEKLDEVELLTNVPVADQEFESEFEDLTAHESSPSMNVLQVDIPKPSIERLDEIETTHSGSAAFSGRGRLQRAAIVREQGGDTLTEKAVEESLKWIARHQNPVDGGFDFQHAHGAAACNCRNAGTHGRNGATGLALLPFLGAGYTHQSGPYKKQIEAALRFLILRMKADPASGGRSLWEEKGQMYSHGLCSIALAEAYAMTNDSRLRAPTLAALRYIVYAQDPAGGGWRYNARQPGDTSVVGWQLMALKSGKMAGIKVPKSAFQNADKFLASVSAESGTWYGYDKPEPGRMATTAVAHLSRMYIGVGRDDPALARGIAKLDEKGPDFGNMYYNYYASQIMHHYGGEPWERWNQRMRGPLVDSQVKQGHEKGSWMFHGPDHGYGAGGRLYSTAMACMMLEVYYRQMPLYQDASADAAKLESWDLE